MHIQGRPYTMSLLNTEPQSFCLEDLDTINTGGHHYLLSKTSDTYIAFYGRPLKLENFWMNLFSIQSKSRQPGMDKGNV